MKVVNKIIEKIRLVISYFRLSNEPGHFYSPIVNKSEIIQFKDLIFATRKYQDIHGIELNVEVQLQIIEKFRIHYNLVPFTKNYSTEFRYYYNNNFFSYNSGIYLFCLIIEFKPNLIIEVGSGFSSALMLDTNEKYFENSIELIFIEPYPENRLYKLLKREDKRSNCKIIDKKIQQVPIDEFKKLQKNDLLFIDSSHVSKTGSDLNRIIFEILPILEKGVIVHFHDIFYPFEYPENWVLDPGGFGWNEIYLLRAFLMNNTEWEIILFNSYLEENYNDWFVKNMPLCLEKQGGSLYIVKKI